MKIKLKHKKIILKTIFWSMVVFLFLATTALLILWASGYKYNFAAKKFQKTGLIYLTSNPKNVKVYINGRLVKEKTPARLGYILPGKYKVEIKKKGYFDWSRETEVTAGKVTRFDNIILFLKNPESSDIAKNVTEFYSSPNKEKVLYFAQNFNLYDLKNKESKSIKTQDKNLKFLEWSPDSGKILFSGPDSYFIYNISDEKLSPLKLDNMQNIKKISWHPKNFERLFLLRKGNLYSLNIKGETKLLILKIPNFTTTEDNLIYISQEKDKYILKKSNFENRNVENIADLKSGDFEILTKNSHIALKGSPGNLYRISENNLKKINSQVESAIWSETAGFLGFAKKTKLLYKTSLDGIWFFDPESEQNSLVYRSEKTIKKILWYSDLNQVIFSCDSEIKITDLDGKNEIIIAQGGDFNLISQKELLYLGQDNALKILQIRE